MFEKFTSEDAHDFRQRYQGTYGWFKRKDKKLLVKLTTVDSDGFGEKVVHFADKDGVPYTLRADSADESVGFEFIPPKTLYHNTSDGVAYLLTRVPARQYLRGICDRNTRIRSVGGNIVPIDFFSLLLLYDGKVTPLEAMETAFENSKKDVKKEHSFALSGQFAVNLTRGAVYCLGAGIGYANVATLPSGELQLSILLEDVSLWGQEVRDAINRAGISGVVEGEKQ